MLNLQKLKYLSAICAYCNKVLPMEERTNDHIIPRCSGGITDTENIVICCPDCNGLKGSTLINEFLETYPQKAECFYNYLNMIDYQTGNDEYSSAISKVLTKSLKMSFARQKRRAKRLRQKQKKQARNIKEQLNEEQNIEYKYELSGKSFYINELQAKILDYYLENPNFSNYKELAQKLGIGKEKLIREITCINNLTGIFKLKIISENGIILNDLQCENIQDRIFRTTN